MKMDWLLLAGKLEQYDYCTWLKNRKTKKRLKLGFAQSSWSHESFKEKDSIDQVHM